MAVPYQLPKTKPVSSISNMGTNPMISQRLVDLCNYRIQQEEYSARIYKAMSKWLENKGYFGSAKLWAKYSSEELEHAEKFYDYLLKFGIQPIVPNLDQPQQTYMSLQEIVNISYDHEIEVYKQCKELALAAFEEQDLMLYPLALQFTSEQSEELEKLQNIKDLLASFGGDLGGMLLIDSKLGELAN